MKIDLIKKQSQELYERLQGQLSENPRLVVGIWIIIIILSLQPIWWMEDLVMDLRNELIQVRQKNEQLTYVSSEDKWLERAQLAQQKMDMLISQFGHAPSTGIASTTLESWINPLLEQVAIEKPRLKLIEPVMMSEEKNYVIAGAEIRGEYQQGQLTELLTSIESYGKLLTVERLDVRLGKRRNTFQLSVNGYFIIETAEVSVQ